MNTNLKALVVALIYTAAVSVPANAVDHYDILSAGYFEGASVSGTVGFDNIFEKVPVGLELELGYSWSSLGEAIPACQVFINQNQNNSKTISSGGTLDLGLNATYPLPQSIGPLKLWVLAGPRFARWDARHEYVNGNEDFDVTGKVWGLGGGLRGIMPLSSKFRAMIQLTVDYYPPACIYGHDATYCPDNDNINARANPAGGNYTYADAQAATAVPHIRPRVMVGFMF